MSNPDIKKPTPQIVAPFVPGKPESPAVQEFLTYIRDVLEGDVHDLEPRVLADENGDMAVVLEVLPELTFDEFYAQIDEPELSARSLQEILFYSLLNQPDPVRHKYLARIGFDVMAILKESNAIAFFEDGGEVVNWFIGDVETDMLISIRFFTGYKAAGASPNADETESKTD